MDLRNYPPDQVIFHPKAVHAAHRKPRNLPARFGASPHSRDVTLPLPLTRSVGAAAVTSWNTPPVPNTHGRPPRHGHAAPGDGTGKHLPPGAVTMPRAPWRPCSTPGCPELVQRGKCSTCTAAVDAARGTPEQRGYDKAHRSRRRQAAPQVATGTVRCWRCGELIAPGEEWDLGHDDEDRSVTRGPEHRGRCNRAAAARKGNANRMH